MADCKLLELASHFQSRRAAKDRPDLYKGHRVKGPEDCSRLDFAVTPRA